MKRSVQHIAEAVGARLIGEGRVEVSAVASIASATPSDLVFVEDEKHLAAALRSRAGAVIAGEFAASVLCDRPLLISDHPKLGFARAARLLREELALDGSAQRGGVHATAVIHSTVVLGPGIYVGERAQIGEHTRMGAGCDRRRRR